MVVLLVFAAVDQALKAAPGMPAIGIGPLFRPVEWVMAGEIPLRGTRP
jgi:hypothetical protein